MAEERRKGPPERRRSAKPAQTDTPIEDSAAVTPESGTPERRGQDPNDVARFDAEELDASIRARQQEDYGEVL